MYFLFISGTIIQLKTKRVGFTVRIGADKDYKGYDQKYVNGQVIVFKKVITNYGHYYNKQNGTFTCRIPGLYIFQLHVHSSSHWSGLWIVKNGQRLSRTSATNHHMKYKKLNKGAYENADGNKTCKWRSNMGRIPWEFGNKSYHLLQWRTGFTLIYFTIRSFVTV